MLICRKLQHMLTITKAGKDQIRIVRELAYKIWPDTFKDILLPEQITYMLQMMYDDAVLLKQVEEQGVVFLLAAVDGVFGGFAGYELHYKGKPVSKLHKIYILPEMQGKSIGRALMDAVVLASRDAGMEHLSLNVNRHNKATGFYERYGFTKVGEEDIDIGNGYFMNDSIMQMKL